MRGNIEQVSGDLGRIRGAAVVTEHFEMIRIFCKLQTLIDESNFSSLKLFNSRGHERKLS